MGSMTWAWEKSVDLLALIDDLAIGDPLKSEILVCVDRECIGGLTQFGADSRVYDSLQKHNKRVSSWESEYKKTVKSVQNHLPWLRTHKKAPQLACFNSSRSPPNYWFITGSAKMATSRVVMYAQTFHHGSDGQERSIPLLPLIHNRTGITHLIAPRGQKT